MIQPGASLRCKRRRQRRTCCCRGMSELGLASRVPLVRRCATVQEMTEGPSRSAIRCRSRAAASRLWRNWKHLPRMPSELHSDFLNAGRVGAADVQSAIDYLSNQRFVLKEGVFVVGQSASGWDTLTLASQNPNRGTSKADAAARSLLKSD